MNRIELSKATEIKRIEAQLNSRQSDLVQIQAQVTEQYDNKKILEQEVIDVQKYRQQLLEEIQVAERSFAFLQAEISQLQRQQQALQQGLISFEEQRKQLEEQLHNLRVSNLSNQETLPQEWLEFRKQLTKSEFLVLRAIAQQANPSQIIKKIAEDEITMPELLIDSINEKAISKIGDLIISPGSISVSPAILSEYAIPVNQLVKSDFIN